MAFLRPQLLRPLLVDSGTNFPFPSSLSLYCVFFPPPFRFPELFSLYPEKNDVESQTKIHTILNTCLVVSDLIVMAIGSVLHVVGNLCHLGYQSKLKINNLIRTRQNCANSLIISLCKSFPTIKDF